MTTNEKELAKAVYVLTESLAASYKLQAGLCRVLAQALPQHEKGFQDAASGIEVCASNLVRDLPPLPKG